MNIEPGTRAEAAQWFAVLRRGPMSLEECERFDEWRAIAGNQRALDELHALWGEVSAAAALSDKLRRPRGGLSQGAIAAAIAALVLAVGSGALLLRPPLAWAEVRTRIGEQQTRMLPDGSVMALNVVTSVSYANTSNRRDVRLSEGEASFNTRRLAGRPFFVDAGDYRVTSLGSSFDVRRRDGIVEVSVGEGEVHVTFLKGSRAGDEIADLAAGQKVRLLPATKVTSAMVTRVAVQSVGEWRMRTVDYDDVTVGQVAEDLNRFFDRPIKVSNSRLAHEHVTIRLQVDDRDKTLKALSEILGVRVRSDGKSDDLLPQ